MYIAIDSSNQMRYTGVVSGNNSEIIRVYSEIEKILRSDGVNPPYHWSKISRKVKDKVKMKIIETINKSRLNFNIFFHRKEINLPKKELFYYRIPNAIAQNLEKWLSNAYGSVEIEVDNDYNIKGYSTEDFVKNFIFQICFRLAGKPVKVRKEEAFKATVKHISGNLLNFYGLVASSNSSKGIQMVDMIMGIFIQSDGSAFDKHKIFFRKI